MPSEFNKAQRKKNLYKAVELRDRVGERPRHSDGKVERLRTSPRFIKEVTGIKTHEAFKIGVFNTPKQKENKKLTDKQLAKATKAKQTTMVPRRIKKQ